MKKDDNIKIRECVKCSRLVFLWTEGYQHIARKHKFRMRGNKLYSDHFNYYK